MSKLVTWWIVVTIAASIVAAMDGGHLASWAALAPSKIWHGEVWRLVTWPLIERSPWGIVVRCLVIYRFAGALAPAWGDARLARFVAKTIIIAGVATCLIALVSHDANASRLGGWTITEILVIGWARQYPERTLFVFEGLFRLRGRGAVGFIALFTLVIAAFVGPLAFVPELVACVVAIGYPTR
jgi:membrane associated rhomboid family serine protease